MINLRFYGSKNQASYRTGFIKNSDQCDDSSENSCLKFLNLETWSIFLFVEKNISWITVDDNMIFIWSGFNYVAVLSVALSYDRYIFLNDTLSLKTFVDWVSLVKYQKSIWRFYTFYFIYSYIFIRMIIQVRCLKIIFIKKK